MILVVFATEYCQEITHENKALELEHQGTIDWIAKNNSSDVLVSKYQILNTLDKRELKLKVIASTDKMKGSQRRQRKDYNMDEGKLKNLFNN